MPHSSDIGMLLKQQQQQQQPQQQQQFGGLQRPVDMMPQMIPSTAESLQLLGSSMKSPNTSSSTSATIGNDADLQNQPFNPIKSLLSQLQQQQQHEDLRQPNDVDNSHPYSPYQDQSPSPPPLAHQSPQVPPRSIWNNHHHQNQNPENNVVQDSSSSSSGVAVVRSSNNTTKIDQWSSNSRDENFRENDFTKKIEEPNSFYNHVQHQREVGSSNNSSGQIQHFTEKSVDNTTTNITGDNDLVDNLIDDESSNGFVKPKSSEKKEKKSKRAEEKKKSREKENNSSSRGGGREYIPGMEGSVRPMDEDEDLEHTQEFYVSIIMLLP